MTSPKVRGEEFYHAARAKQVTHGHPCAIFLMDGFH